MGRLFVGDPRGVLDLKAGRHHKCRIARWEVGKDIDCLCHKAEQASITFCPRDEHWTSSRCLQCGHRHQPKGGDWQCKSCGFAGGRDMVEAGARRWV
ncbi:MAG: zinc ribbon domain-containing protein [Microvirga sp.]